MPDIAPDGFIYDSAGRRIDPQSGQLYVREEDPEFRRYIDYLGYSPEQAAQAMGYDPNDQNTWGRWVQGTDKPDTFYKTLGLFLAGAGLGGLGGGYLAPLIGGAAGGGAAGGGAAAGTAGGTAAGTAAGTTAAATAVPTLGVAGGTALPASLVSSTAVPGLVGGGAAAGTTAAATGLPAGFSGVGGTGIGGTTAAVPTLGATSAVPIAPVASTGGGGGILGGLKKAYDVYSGAGSQNAGVGDYVDAGLKVAGSIEQGRSADRAQQNAQIAAENARDIERYKLERANALTNFNAPQARTNQVAIGDILRNWQPFTYDSKTRTMTGGLTPALFSDRTRQAGDVLSKQALDAMLSGNPAGLPDIPTPRDPVQGNKIDTTLNALNTAGGIIEAGRAVQSKKNDQNSIDELIRIYGRQPGPNVQQPGPVQGPYSTAPRSPTGTTAGVNAPRSIVPDDYFTPPRRASFDQTASTSSPTIAPDPWTFNRRALR